MNQKKLKVGITGSIGSGKSTFSKFIADTGFKVINVDDISKELLVSDKLIKEKIIELFGKESYIGDEVNKKYLAEKVFSNSEQVAKINSIVHPAAIKKTESLILQNLKDANIAFAEAALIYEADMENIFDFVILVTTNEKLRLDRKVRFDNYTKEQFLKRNENQIPDDEKKKRADFVIENSGSLEELKSKCGFIIKILQGLILTNE
ncbi:MAG TPA: dephospho-CoA kinase [Ignavibacteriaceae bacterium]|nr:dephospho-CoA kinase [Ignavibacteriaceae bacterium]